MLYEHRRRTVGGLFPIDRRTLAKPRVVRERFAVLDYLATKTKRGEHLVVVTEYIAEDLAMSRTTVWRHLDWLHDHHWIIWPHDKRKVRETGEKHYWRSEVQINWDYVVGGYTVEEWARALKPLLENSRKVKRRPLR